MKNRRKQSGFAVIIILLILVIILLLTLLSIPIYRQYKASADKTACKIELATAKDMLTIDYLTKNGTPTPGDVKDEVTYAMDGWDDLCQAGGDTYVIKNSVEEPPFTVVCGIHDEDTAQRTRLNAGSAFRKIKEELKKAKDSADQAPDEITILLNSKKYTCIRVDEDKKFRHGTKLTIGYEKKKCVIFYGLNGEGDFKDNTLPKDSLCYFCFADQEHCANWTASDGWTGDSYSQSGN